MSKGNNSKGREGFAVALGDMNTRDTIGSVATIDSKTKSWSPTTEVLSTITTNTPSNRGATIAQLSLSTGAGTEPIPVGAIGIEEEHPFRPPTPHLSTQMAKTTTLGTVT